VCNFNLFPFVYFAYLAVWIAGVMPLTLRRRAAENLSETGALLDPPPLAPKPEIGFHVKEDALPYRVRKKLVEA
jgi:hypothetical protein